MANEIQVYGTDWCGLTFRVREYLMKARLGYDFFDVDRDPQAHEFVLAMTGEHRRFPLVVVGDDVVAHATIPELERALNANAIERP